MAEMELKGIREALGSFPHSATDLCVLTAVSVLHSCFCIHYIGQGRVALRLRNPVLVE